MSGRPHSPGLKYFPVDVDIFRNSKILDLKEDYRSEGLIFYMQLLSTIYSRGHYLIWDRSTNRDFRQAYEYTDAQIKQYIEAVLNVNLLSKPLFEKYNVLTSDAIQERYLYSTKKRERIYYIQDYLLINFNDYRSIPQPVHILDINGNTVATIIKAPDQKYTKKSLNQQKPATSGSPQPISKPIPKIIEEKSDLIEHQLTADHYREPELEKEVESFFHYNEQSNYHKWVKFGHFQTSLKNSNQLSWFKLQWSAYKILKKDSKYQFNFDNFLGNQSMLFMDGAWNKENWEEKLKIELAEKNSKNGFKKTSESKSEQALSGHENFINRFKKNE